jgi:hypothetical protein
VLYSLSDSHCLVFRTARFSLDQKNKEFNKLNKDIAVKKKVLLLTHRPSRSLSRENVGHWQGAA